MKSQMFAELGAFLREARAKAGLSQTEIAEVLRVKPQFVSNWERGMSAMPLKTGRIALRLYRINPEEYVGRYLESFRGHLCRELACGGGGE